MRVAHLAVVTPSRCGLYETTRELVTYLRRLGVDSRLVDPTFEKNTLHPKGEADREAKFGDMNWAVEADIIVNHSGFDNTPVGNTNQPVVHICHGRPKSSFISEVKGSTPIYSYSYHKNLDPRFKHIVTFWPQHKPYLDVLFPNKKVSVVQSCVDLDVWTPYKEDKYDFHGKKGPVNIVSTDAFRDDVDPFVPLNAFVLWSRAFKASKLHLYARPKEQRGWGVLLKRIKEEGTLGEVLGWTLGLDKIYRAASFTLTAQEIDTRSVRESMACGCPVVRMTTLEDDFLRKFHEGILTNRKHVRKYAEDNFNPEVTAKQFKEILEGI